VDLKQYVIWQGTKDGENSLPVEYTRDLRTDSNLSKGILSSYVELVGSFYDLKQNRKLEIEAQHFRVPQYPGEPSM
jgi:hypothetical protein